MQCASHCGARATVCAYFVESAVCISVRNGHAIRFTFGLGGGIQARLLSSHLPQRILSRTAQKLLPSNQGPDTDHSLECKNAASDKAGDDKHKEQPIWCAVMNMYGQI